MRLTKRQLEALYDITGKLTYVMSHYEVEVELFVENDSRIVLENDIRIVFQVAIEIPENPPDELLWRVKAKHT